MDLLRDGCQNEIASKLRGKSDQVIVYTEFILTINSCSKAGLTVLSALLALCNGSNAAGSKTVMIFSSKTLLLATYSRTTPVWKAMRARWTLALRFLRTSGKTLRTKRATSGFVSSSRTSSDRCSGFAVVLYARRNRNGWASLEDELSDERTTAR